MQTTVSEDREKYIGGSDLGAIIGISPFKTRFELLQEKAGLRKDDFVSNIYTEYGNTMEPKIRDYISKLDGVKYKEGMEIVLSPEDSDIGLGIRVHTDGETEDTIVEIKTTSETYETVGEYKLYLCQLVFYLMKKRKPKGILLVYHRPEDMSERFSKKRLQIFRIKIADCVELAEEVATAEYNFRQDLKRLKENPNLTELDFLPFPVVIQAEALSLLEQKLQALDEIEQRCKGERQKLYDLMWKYGVKTIPMESMTISRVDPIPESTKKVFDEKAFEKEHPEVYKAYMKDKKVSGKKGYIRIITKEKEE